MTSLKTQQIEGYQNIMHMLGVVERIVQAIERPEIKNRREQMEIVGPLIDVSTKSIEEMISAYTQHIKRGGKPTREDAIIIEDAMRRIFNEIVIVADKISKIQPTT